MSKELTQSCFQGNLRNPEKQDSELLQQSKTSSGEKHGQIFFKFELIIIDQDNNLKTME
jgi:hypothetical protein